MSVAVLARRAALVTAGLFVPVCTHAQSPTASDSARGGVSDEQIELDGQWRANACVRALPPSAYTRVPVLVYGEVVDTLDRAARPTVDLIAQSVARQVRAFLWPSTVDWARGDSTGQLPLADSLFAWYALQGGVRVVVQRGGAVRWYIAAPPGSAAPDSAAAALLARAVAAVRDSGELFVPDELVRGDSLVFALRHTYPSVDSAGRLLPSVRERNPTPVFTLPVLQERQSGLARGLSVRYPATLQQQGFQGTIVVKFVVDTTGRVERGTIRDAYPAVAGSLASHLRGAYADFVAAVREALGSARFFPATVGGCAVRQLVQQSVSFELRR